MNAKAMESFLKKFSHMNLEGNSRGFQWNILVYHNKHYYHPTNPEVAHIAEKEEQEKARLRDLERQRKFDTYRPQKGYKKPKHVIRLKPVPEAPEPTPGSTLEKD